MIFLPTIPIKEVRESFIIIIIMFISGSNLKQQFKQKKVTNNDDINN